jgi:ABC-type Fe3+ transport system substrate-binding protein
MPIRIVPITPDSDAKRRKKTTSRIKGTPSERARDKKSLKALEESYKNITDPEYKGGLKIIDLNEGGRTVSKTDRDAAGRYLKRNDGGIARKTRTF